MAQTSAEEPNIIDMLEIGAVVGSDRELYARWMYSVSNTDSFQVQFDYRANIDSSQSPMPDYLMHDDDIQWFKGTDTTIKYGQYDKYGNGMHATTYTPPEAGTRVRFRVKPIATKHKVNGVDTPYYTSKWSKWVYYTYSTYVDHTPERPSAPTVELTDTNLKAYIDTYDENTKYVKFELIEDDSKNIGNLFATVKMNRAIVWFTRPTGGVRYKVRCRGYYTYSGGDYSNYGEFSEYSEDLLIPPWIPGPFTKSLTKLVDPSTIQIFWPKVEKAETYELQYTTNQSYFDSSEEVQTIEVENNTHTESTGKRYSHCEVTGLTYQPSTVYYFRVRSKNEAGVSNWNKNSEGKSWPYFSMRTGVAPSAPTTWSENSVLSVGSRIYLYWTHNSEDGSTQKKAQIEFTLNHGNSTTTFTRDLTGDDGGHQYYVVNPSEEPSGSEFLRIADGDTLSWRVRTAGVIQTQYSPWSVKRTINFYANPSVSVTLRYVQSGSQSTTVVNNGGTIRNFPFTIRTVSSPASQTPKSITYSIIATETYETTDNRGEPIRVVTGETIYSETVNTPNDNLTQDHRITPWMVTLEDDVTYRCKVVVLTSAGLSAENSMRFTFNSIERVDVRPSADVVIDTDLICTYITPSCYVFDRVVINELYYGRSPTQIGTNEWEYAYTLSKEPTAGYSILFVRLDSGLPGSPDPYNFTYRLEGDSPTIERHVRMDFFGVELYKGTRKQFYRSYDSVTLQALFVYDGDKTITVTFEGLNDNVLADVSNFNMIMQYSTGDELELSEIGDRVNHIDGICEEEIVGRLRENTELSVYRRDIDGGFTEIATGIDNDGISTLTDPHPALDFARYRVVSKDTVDGSNTFYDLPDYPIKCPYLVIDWEEQWRNYAIEQENESTLPVYTTSRVKIKGNVDVSNSYSQDVSLVEYIGRSHPVAYHGTQVGETASWSCVIPADDKDTLSSVRRLAKWMGVCYVREPSGSGYWATVGVSFSQTHSEVIIPITFAITRIEGGI